MIDNEQFDEHIDKILNRNRYLIWYDSKVEQKRTIIGGLVLLGFAAMMTVGIVLGDLEGNLLPKAVRFCLECIGIG